MTGDLRLSAADMVIINAALVYSIPVIEDQDMRKMALDCAAEAIGRGNPHNPYMAAILAPLRQLIDPRPPSGPTTRQGVEIELSQALGRLCCWRLAKAQDALRGEQGA